MERCECLPLHSKFARKSVLVKTKPFNKVISINQSFKVLSTGTNTCPQPWPPLINGLVDDAVLELSPDWNWPLLILQGSVATLFSWSCIYRIIVGEKPTDFAPIWQWVWETDMDETWQRDGEWAQSDLIKFLARSLQKLDRKEPKTNLFRDEYHAPVCNGHFRFTDFRQIWQECECENQCPH